MAITPTYPGVYVQEIPSGVRTITGVATSVTAFIGPAQKGPTDRAVRVQSFSDFDRQFGGLWINSIMGHMVQQFFLNGGAEALIIRVVADNAVFATATVSSIQFVAASPGAWMNDIQITIDQETNPLSTDDTLFNITVEEVIPDQGLVQLEQFRNVSPQPSSSRFAPDVLSQNSRLIRINLPIAESRPVEGSGAFSGGEDGTSPTYENYQETTTRPQTGLQALDSVDIFNLLCVAPNQPGNYVAGDDGGNVFLTAALRYCEEKRAILIVDPPESWNRPADVADDNDSIRTSFRSKNAVIYYPNPRLPDPLRENRLQSFPPSGIMAGVMSRTDSQRGVWKAPAGTEATLSGVREFTYKLNDNENGTLNPLGVNCLRNFPVYGNVAWGARTLEGADQLASEWKYVPVRRLALFLQESLYRGTQWVVFEPNDEPLWAQIRLNIGAFMNNLFRQGAFQGTTPKEAYFVKCDSETTTQNDIDRGIVNILIGFAPLKPAEFVILKFQQIAGQLET
jgi:uncharacterized protein